MDNHQYMKGPMLNPKYPKTEVSMKRTQSRRAADTAQLPSPKINESDDTVRCKLRDSLAAALRLIDDKDRIIASTLTVVDGDKDQDLTSETENRTDAVPQPMEIRQETTNKEQEALGSVALDEEKIRKEGQSKIEDESNFVVSEENPDSLEAEENPSKKMKLEVESVEVEDKSFKQAPDLAERVAFDVESEMYRHFGGVNRKYKEKARSLLFNLKDRSNPELRARVLSGEITPENLCSMNAEQLASKELSEWRIAKAEEFAHMIVLTEPDGGQPRLVKKTHKGEFEVTVEKDDVLTEVVTAGSQQRVALPFKQEAADVPESLSVTQESGNTTVDVNGGKQQNLAIRELNSETFAGYKKESAMDSGDTDSDIVSGNSKDRAPQKVVKSPNHSSQESGVSKNGVTSLKERKNEHKFNETLWEGSFQLSGCEISPILTIYKSGDAIELQNWPKQIEIKGRVKLDALEKFLQELRLSRARAVMITTCQVDGKESDHVASINALKEAANQYQRGERVGYAEPLPGYELYLFPGSGNSLRLLVDHGYLTVDQLLVEEEGLLVGFVVCRRSLIPSTTTHKPSSHYFNANKSALSAQLDSPTRPNGNQWSGNIIARSKAPLLPLPTAKEYENHHAPVSFVNLQKDVSIPNKNVEGGMISLTNKCMSNIREQRTCEPLEFSRSFQGSRSGRGKSEGLEKDLKQELNIGDDLPPGFGPKAMKRRFAMDESDDLPEYEFSAQSILPYSSAQHFEVPPGTLPLHMQGPHSIGNPSQQHAGRFNSQHETSNISGLQPPYLPRPFFSHASGQLEQTRPLSLHAQPSHIHVGSSQHPGLLSGTSLYGRPHVSSDESSHPPESKSNLSQLFIDASRPENAGGLQDEWTRASVPVIRSHFTPSTTMSAGQRGRSSRLWNDDDMPEWCPETPSIDPDTQAPGNSRSWQSMPPTVPLLLSSPVPLEGGDAGATPAAQFYPASNRGMLPMSRPEHYRSQKHWPQ